ncbi:MAG: SPOR domain-containing protein [Pseudomonadota bacterium]
MLQLLIASNSQATTRTLDRIEVKLGDEENTITVHLNIPVRYVSHVVNESGTEVDLQLQVIQTRDVDISDLLATDQLSWNPSAEMPLDKVVFRGQAVGTSTMQVSFASPVKDFQVRQGKNFDIVEFVLKKKKKVVQVPVKPAPTPGLPIPEPRPPLTFKELPLVIYVVNLSSELNPIDFSAIAPIPVDDRQTLYTTQVMVKGRPWYRLRLGFYRTMQDAKAQLKTMKNFYPDAWIDRADVEEQRQAMELPEGAPLPAPVERVAKPGVSKPKLAPITPADPRLAKMMELTRRTMTAGEYAKAVRMLEAILEEPDNPYDKEARELLGLARERNGQIAHAKAEYRTYLELYPEGEDAKRVNQRLLGLVTATQKPREPLRKEKKRKMQVEWETYGSLSQNYRRDVIDSPFVEEEESVTRSEIETLVDLNTRRRGEDIDMRMKLTTSYIHDMLDEEQGDGDDSSLSDAYLDLEHRGTRSNMRLGRQRLRSSGVLNRFDGLVLGYELTPDVQIRAVGGLPVERSKDVFLHEHKTFAGINGDISNIIENWDLSLFFIEQRVDDLIDRRAVGGELRYFDPKRSLFSLVDYDIHYASLNTFMMQGNWTLEDETRLYMNLDHRNSPVLTTSSVIGYSYPDPIDPNDPNDEQTQLIAETVEELKLIFSDDEIYQLAEDRTAKTNTLSFGISRPLFPTLQLSGDVTITNTGDTATTDGTGNEYFYTLQVIKNDLLKEGDIGIFSLRYSDANTSNTIKLSASSRYPVTNFWRFNPKFSVSYRENEGSDGNRLMVSPFLQMDYRFRKSITIEFEAGMNWFEEDDGNEVTNFTDYFFLAGYRWDF